MAGAEAPATNPEASWTEGIRYITVYSSMDEYPMPESPLPVWMERPQQPRHGQEEPSVEPVVQRQPRFVRRAYVWRPITWPCRQETLDVGFRRRKHSDLSAMLMEGNGLRRCAWLANWLEAKGFLDSTDFNTYFWMLGTTSLQGYFLANKSFARYTPELPTFEPQAWYELCSLGTRPDRLPEIRLALQVCIEIVMLHLIDVHFDYVEMFRIIRPCLAASWLWRRAMLCLAGVAIENRVITLRALAAGVTRSHRQRMAWPFWFWITPDESRRSVEGRVVQALFAGPAGPL